MKHVFSLILLLLPFYIQADTQIKEIPLTAFSKVLLIQSMDTQVIQSDEEKLIIRGDAQFIEYVQTQVKDDELTISLSHSANNGAQTFSNSSRIQLKLYVKNLSQITNLGSGDLFFKNLTSQAFTLNLKGSGNASFGTVEASEMTMALTGSGDCKLVNLIADTILLSSQGSGDIAVGEMQTKSLAINLAGSGDLSIKLPSQTQQQTISIMGSGDYSAKQLTSNTTKIDIMGSGDAIITVIENLNANVFGSGDLVYHGNPVVTQTALGSGEILSAQK